jgi:hypothetical protein
MDFKATLAEALKKNNVSENTSRIYLRIMKLLNGGSEPNNLSFLEDVETVKPKLKMLEKGEGEVSENTYKNRLTAVIAVLNATSGNTTQLYRQYKELFNNVRNKLENVAKSGVMSEKEKANWVPLQEIHTVLDAKKLKAQKPDATYDDKLDYFILSLYLDLEPARLQDYTEMWLVFKVKEYNTDFNYLIMPENKMRINIHKTAKQKGYKDIDLKGKTAFLEALSTYTSVFTAKMKKSSNPIRLLRDAEGKAFTPDNLRYRLHKIFGKPISTQMLRKINATGKAPNIPKDELTKLQQRAKEMGHTTDTHINYYIKEQSN